MKNKISYLALSFFIYRASFTSITSNYLLKGSRQISWLTFLISSVLSLPIILIYNYYAKTNKNKTLLYEIKKLYPFISKIIIFFIKILFFSIITINFYNLIKIVSLQYLYKTPKIVTSIILIIPIYYLSQSTINTYKNTIVLLFYISIFLYIITVIGLIPKLNITNIFPLNEYNAFSNISYPLCFNTIPLFIILDLPNQSLDNKFIYGYIIGSLSITVMLFLMIGILGIDLLVLFNYPEFFTLKLAYDGFINIRLQNILGIQYILDLIVFISLGLKCTFQKKSNINIMYVIFLMIVSYIINIYNIKIVPLIIIFLQYGLLVIPFLLLFLIKKRDKIPLKNN